MRRAAMGRSGAASDNTGLPKKEFRHLNLKSWPIRILFQMVFLQDIERAVTAPSGAEWGATLVMALLLAWLTVVDLRHFRIPDAASIPLILVGLGCSIALPQTSPQDALVGAVSGYAVFAGIGAVFFRLTGKDGLGLGDAKLLAACGAWLGWRDLPMLVAGAALAGLVFAVITGRRKIAFGPWLAMALWVFWILRISA